MPEKKTLERARSDARRGKAPSSQAGEFVREEIEHIREGKHGTRSAKQAIHRAVEGQAGGCEITAAKKGQDLGEDSETSSTQLCSSTESNTTGDVSHQIASG